MANGKDLEIALRLKADLKQGQAALEQLGDAVTKTGDDAAKANAQVNHLGETIEQQKARIQAVVAATMQQKAAQDDYVSTSQRAAATTRSSTASLDASIAAQNASAASQSSAERAIRQRGASEQLAAEQTVKATAETRQQAAELAKLLGSLDSAERGFARLDNAEQTLNKAYREGRVELDTYRAALEKIGQQRNDLNSKTPEAKASVKAAAEARQQKAELDRLLASVDGTTRAVSRLNATEEGLTKAYRDGRLELSAYRYYFDIHFGIGLPIDEICQIQASGKVAWSGSITNNGQVYINAPNLFGGDTGEGGLEGTLDVMFGEENQTVVSRLAAMLGGIVPAFRGVTTAFYSGLVTSMNPYPKPWMILRRGGNRLWDDGGAWYPGKQFIWLANNAIKSMNPAHILFLMYTGRRFRGLPREYMDDAAWRMAADQLYSEQFGLCLEWKRSDSFKSFRDSVLAHISAEVYLDRSTGLISIRLLRDDYDVSKLPLFDEDSGLLEVTQMEASSSDGDSAPSELIVKYEDAVTGDARSVRAVNSAIAQRDRGRSSETVEYPGAPTGEIAGRLATRDLRIKTSGLKRYKVVLDRRARNLTPGQPFRIRSLKRGIDTVVVRAGRIEDGTLNDGRMTVTALQDVFGLPASSFVAVPPPNWLPPDRIPQAATVRRLFELPYRELAGTIDPANLQLLDSTACYMAALAEAPTPLSLSYTLTDRVGNTGNFSDRGVKDWCPTGKLVARIGKGERSLTVASASRLVDVVVGTAALLDDEIIRVDGIDYATGVVTIARGCSDTVPTEHAAGARIWFYDGFEGADETAYSMGLTMQAHVLTNTSQGQLDPALSSTDSLVLLGRQGRPYPPGQFRVSGSSYPENVVGSLGFSWAHRDRLTQADQLIDTSLGNIGPEPGTAYNLKLYSGSVLLRAYTNIAGTALAYSAADQLADGLQATIRITLESERAGSASWQRHDTTINRYGLGFRLGEKLGGIIP